ncbi:MAG: caspase family protein [Caldilineaceae bacterium]
MQKKQAILVGLCQVSPAAYDGWNGASGCQGCELDVDNVGSILSPLGYDVQTLKTTAATKAAILDQLDAAATSLTAGDTLVFYFAGHGGQQPDQNGDELDGRDETLLAYDGQIIDDQLNDIWGKFQPGVRIVMLSDSCNSGTNYRAVRDVRIATPIRPVDETVGEAMKAELIHMGGCRDGFTSSGYEQGGEFTLTLNKIWQGGAFVGNYKALHSAIAAAVTSGQIPQYNEYGPVTDSFRNESPFAGPAPATQPEPEAPPPPRADSELSDENQRLLIEAYLKLLEKLGAAPAPQRARAVGNRQLVCVHGISTHVSGYSNTWWAALKPYTTIFGNGDLGGTRHEVLWSNLVNSRALNASRSLAEQSAEEDAAAILKARILDVLEDRQRQQAAPAGRMPAARAEAARGLAEARAQDFSFDDFITYMVNRNVRQQIIDRFTDVVRPLLAAGAEINIISHSWGTVVAYEGLRELEAESNLSGRVANFFTVGSALSMPPVRGSLRSTNRDGRRPAMVARWINLDAQGDLVGGTLADIFAVDVEKLELEPVGCTRSLGGWGWYNLQCAHASYFRAENQLVNQQIFAQYINT